MSSTDPPPTIRWLTRQEVADRLRVSPATVDRYVREEYLAPYSLPGGGDRRYRQEDVDSLPERRPGGAT